MMLNLMGTVFPEVWERWAVHQDFAWFAVVLTWGWVALLWLRHPERWSRWRWVLPVAVAAAAIAALQFMVYDPTFDWFQDRLVPGSDNVFVPAVISVELLADFLSVLVWAGLAVVWGGWGRSGGRWWGLGWGVVAGVAAAVHFARPDEGAVGLVAVVAGGAAAAVRAGQSRGVLVLPGILAVSPVGPLAAWADVGQRDAAASGYGLLAALGWVGLAAMVGRALWVQAWAAEEPEDTMANRRELRLYLLVTVVVLVVGVGFAHRVGVDNRRELHQNRLRSVAAEARSFDPALVRPLTGAALRVERGPAGPGEVEPDFLRAPVLAGAEAQELRRALAKRVRETPFLDEARLLVVHDGWLLELATSRPALRPDRVVVLRAATSEDLVEWAMARPYIEAATVPRIGAEYYCRAPILDTDGKLLGWLDYVRTEFFQSLERKWRAGPLLVVALGLVAGGLMLTQRRSVRERERAWRSAALETEANRLKTAFLAKVSHELRTPLQSLLGYSELLERDAADEVARRRLGRLREHGDVLLRLVNDLLDLSAIEVGELRLLPAPVELGRVVRAAVADLEPRATARGLALEVETGPEWADRWFEADATRLRQIVYNLVGNAVKFTDHGRVTVRLREVGEESAGRRVRLQVEDTGPGIPRAAQARLFEAFSRLEKTAAREGSGLGLAMVAALARLMGGSVRVDSDGHSGTCFTVEVVLPEVSPPAFTREEAAVTPAALSGRRIVVAEDNALVRELFVTVLTEHGAQCVTASDGHEALQTVLAGPCDAMVLDLALPGLDGVEVARRLRAPGVSPRALRILGVSAHADKADEARALAAGMDVFLRKPVPLGALVAALAGESTALAPSRPSSAALRQRLHTLFAATAPAQRAALETAVADRDGPAIRRAAHYLANSAAAVGDGDLARACAGLEDAARRDIANVPAAMRAVEQALDRRLGGD